MNSGTCPKCPRCSEEMHWWGYDGDWHCSDCEEAEYNEIQILYCTLCKQTLQPSRKEGIPDCYVIKTGWYDSEDTIDTEDTEAMICRECYAKMIELKKSELNKKEQVEN